MKTKTIIVIVVIAAIVVVTALFVVDVLQGNNSGTFVSVPVGQNQ